MCYKIINNHTCIQIPTFPAFSSINKTRGNSRKLDKSHVSSVRDGHFFVKRIVNVWNSLPDCIVMFNSVVAFRQKLKQLHFSDFCNT